MRIDIIFFLIFLHHYHNLCLLWLYVLFTLRVLSPQIIYWFY